MSYGQDVNWLLWCPECLTEHPLAQIPAHRRQIEKPTQRPKDSSS